ncbi:hypothetical protein [uncultured Fibrobacter sp.]|uniref:hypothetical protein n=1 Tax=uncultured Fibrobacter sp. TaxID=261512 RepID=UPI00261BAAE7|nr:hypothetical protein [uncultured Fibrobacter sp.]
MAELKNKSIADTFNARIRSPWAWVVLAVAVGLTVLFYFSQKPQIFMYSRYIKTLSDYQLQESYAMRGMERVRIGFGVDTVFIQAQTMTLRETAVAFSREMDEINHIGIKAPPHSAVERFEREVLAKVSSMRRYTESRKQWQEKLQVLKHQTTNLPTNIQISIHEILDSARAGYLIGAASLGDSIVGALPETFKNSLFSLMQENEEQALAWNRFNNEMAIMYSEDLIQFFQSQSIDEMSLKSKIPMAFYFLTLVLMLSTFFFIFRSKQ